MTPRAFRTLLPSVVLLALMMVTATARAWVTSAVESSVVTVDVDRAGQARVLYELIVRVRGGPLKAWTLRGVDADLGLLSDSTATPIASPGRPGAEPVALLGQMREDASLLLEVDHPRGLRAGRYLFRFSYRTDLREKNQLRSDAGTTELIWVGPRYDDGVGSARVIFRLPPGGDPKLVEADAEAVTLGLAEDPGGVFVASLRRAADKDELEVVRPHVAKGEPAVFRVRTQAQAFQPAGAPIEPAAPPADERADPARAPTGWGPLVAGALAALLYALVLIIKWRWAERASAQRFALARALVPLRPALRASLAGVLLGTAFVVGARNGSPTLGGVCLVFAMLLATQGSPRVLPRLRGPGRWLALREEDVVAGPAPRLPGYWLDAGTAPGFLAFGSCLTGFGGLVLYLLSSSPYQAALAALGSLSLLPIFFSGRLAELPPDPAHAPEKLLKFLIKELEADAPEIKTVWWGRVPENAQQPDEIRLLVRPEQALEGFLGIEVGLEYQQGVSDFVAVPYVMVRVREESASYFALPRTVVWTRGRKPEERVAILRPRLPTRQLCLALVRRLVSFLKATGPVPFQPGSREPAFPRRVAISSGRGSATSKPVSSRVPAHAT